MALRSWARYHLPQIPVSDSTELRVQGCPTTCYICQLYLLKLYTITKQGLIVYTAFGIRYKVFRIEYLAAEVKIEPNRLYQDPSLAETIRGPCLANWHATDALAKSVR